MENKQTNSNFGLFQGGPIGLVVKTSYLCIAAVLCVQLMLFLQLAERYVLLQEAQAGYPAAKAMLEKNLMDRMELVKENKAK